MRAVWAIAIKDIRLLLRDPMGLFFTVFFPFFYCVFFGAVFTDWGQSATEMWAGRVPDTQTDEMIRHLVDQPATIIGADDGSANPIIEARVEQGPRPRTQYDLLFPQAVMWGVLGCAATFSVAFVVERTGGTMSRLRMAPVRWFHILAGKGLACLLIVSGLMLGLTIVAVGWLGVVPDSYVHLALAMLGAAYAFAGIMMLLATIPATERAAGGISWAALMTMAMLGGGVIPLFMMPPWLKTLAMVSPVRWSIRAIEGAVWRGDSTFAMLGPLGVLVLVGTTGIALGCLALKWRQAR